MPRRKPSHKKRKAVSHPRPKSSTRPIWKGSINFGLVSIPVALYSAEADSSVEFDLLDKRDFSHVRYRRVNEKTGETRPVDP
jgi:DNA end-binding protein Ku